MQSLVLNAISILHASYFQKSTSHKHGAFIITYSLLWEMNLFVNYGRLIKLKKAENVAYKIWLWQLAQWGL